MAAKANPRIVGGFVVGAVALLVVTLALFGGGNLLAERPRAGTYFRGSVAGLTIGAPVTYQGVRIGEVTSIRLEMDSTTLAARMPVEFELDPGSVQWTDGRIQKDEYRRLIDKGLRTKLVSQSLVTGLLAVELGYYPDSPPDLVGGLPPAVVEIPSVQSDLESLKATLGDLPLRQIADTLTQVLLRVDGLLAMPEIRSTVASLAAGLQQFVTLMESLNRQAGPLIGDVRQVTGKMDGAIVDLRDLLRAIDAQMQPLGSSLQGAAGAAERAFRQADATLRTVDGAVDQRSMLRVNLEQMLANLAVASKSLRSFADQIDRRPSVVITGR